MKSGIQDIFGKKGRVMHFAPLDWTLTSLQFVSDPQYQCLQVRYHQHLLPAESKRTDTGERVSLPVFK